MKSFLKISSFALISLALADEAVKEFPSLDEIIESLKTDAHSPDLQKFMVHVRRYLHQHPEPSYHEHNTSKYIQEQLTKLNIPFTTGWGVNKDDHTLGGTGIIAHIGTKESPCIGLRSDIDALKIHEDTSDGVIDFPSLSPGNMHACGHDGHISMLLGAAKLLKEREALLPGTVRLIFQPAEEGGAGAYMMEQEGVLDMHPRVERIFGLHQMPFLPTNFVGSRAGGIMAGSDFFDGVFTCRGGHAAQPHLARDPVIALAQFITAVQSIVSRETNPLQAAVVSVTKVESSSQHNVIADTASFGGTFRSYSLEAMQRIKTRISEIADAVATLNGCTAKVDYLKYPYIPTVNDEAVWKEVREQLSFLNEDNTPLKEVEPIMPGEDFSFFLAKRPGVFFFLGSGKKGYDYPLHSPKFKFDEDVMPTGALLLSATAFKQLHSLQAQNEPVRV